MESESRTRKRRTTHQVVTVLLVFLMGVALGWVLRGSPEQPGDAPLPVELVAVPDEPSVPEAAPVDDAPPPETWIPEVAQVLDAAAESDEIPIPQPLEDEPPAEAAEEEMPPTSPPMIFEDVWPARHLFIAISGGTLNNATKTLLSDLKPGGVVLLDGNIENRNQTIKLVSSIKEAVGLGKEIYDLPLIAVEQEGGIFNRLNLESAPGAPELGAKRDPQAANTVGLNFGKACKDRGIAVLLAPVLDVVLPGAPDVIKARSFGKDRDVVQALGLAFADGAMQSGVFPVGKHYPGHGAAKLEAQTTLAVIDLNESHDLAKVLYPFAQAVVAGVPGILVGHIAVPRLDMNEPQRPASLSPVLVREILRERWTFKGVILSDDIALAASATGGDAGKAAVLALAAGCDALILADPSPERIRGICDTIETAVNDGTLARENLNESKRRLEAMQTWLKTPKSLPGGVPKLAPESSTPVEVAAEAAPEPAKPAEAAPKAPEQAEPAPETPKPAETAAETPKPAEVTPPEAAPEPPKPAETAPEPPKPADPAPETPEQVEPAPKPADPAPETPRPADPAPETPRPADPAPETPEQAEPAPEPPKPVETAPEPPRAADPAPEPPKPAEPAPEAPPAEAASSGGAATHHEVQPGDTLTRLSLRYGVSIDELKGWNNLDGDTIQLGQKLRVSPSR
ncbi:MAG: glycoside hydrolase family 3 N-terminal domain-containing protein [Candidatus Hydrogenedentales bacterium]